MHDITRTEYDEMGLPHETIVESTPYYGNALRFLREDVLLEAQILKEMNQNPQVLLGINQNTLWILTHHQPKIVYTIEYV